MSPAFICVVAVCVQQAASIAAAATSVPGGYAVELSLPAGIYTQGQPVCVAVTLRNAGSAALVQPAPWYWPRGQRPAWRLERAGDAGWQEVSRADWGRPMSWLYDTAAEQQAVPNLRLDPGESCLVWVDLAWSFELPPGRYRASLGQAAPLSFEVRAPEGRAAEVWRDGQAADRRDYGWDRHAWMLRLPRERLDGTPFAPWADYLACADAVRHPGARQGEEAGSPGPLARLAQSGALDPAFPMHTRLELLRQACAASPAKPAGVVDLRRALLGSNDPEWVELLTPYAVRADLPPRGERTRLAFVQGRAADYEATLARWGYPWFALSAEQRRKLVPAPLPPDTPGPPRGQDPPRWPAPVLTGAPPTVSLELPRAAYWAGEPVYTRLTLRNADAQASVQPALWNWRQTAGQPPVFGLQVSTPDGWQDVPAGAWSRQIDWVWGTAYRSRAAVRLEPGQSYQVWADLGWQYDLPAGRYRVRWQGPGRAADAAWSAFEVRDPEGPAALANQAGQAVVRACARRGAKMVDFDRRCWLPRADAAGLAGTPYAVWARYLKVELALGLGLPGMEDYYQLQPAFWTELDAALAEATVAGFPFRHRLELVRDVLRPLQGLARPADLAAARRTLLAEPDLEWVDLITPFAIRWSMPPRGTRTDAEWLFDRGPERVDATYRWHFPWFHLPADERQATLIAGR